MPTEIALLARIAVGFALAYVVVQYRDAFIRGITTASAIFATAGIGIVVGTGHLGLDARHYRERFRDDDDPPRPFRPRS